MLVSLKEDRRPLEDFVPCELDLDFEDTWREEFDLTNAGLLEDFVDTTSFCCLGDS